MGNLEEQDKRLQAELELQMAKPCTPEDVTRKMKEFETFANDFQINIHAEEEPERVVNKFKGIL